MSYDNITYILPLNIVGSFNGSLDGIPVAYKDIFCTSSLSTTCGSFMLKSYKFF
jgi:Asp-tRNA(Asn)/Glu-tRNA(Gln) amidotransferase A subunit family amidase